MGSGLWSGGLDTRGQSLVGFLTGCAMSFERWALPPPSCGIGCGPRRGHLGNGYAELRRRWPALEFAFETIGWLDRSFMQDAENHALAGGV